MRLSDFYISTVTIPSSESHSLSRECIHVQLSVFCIFRQCVPKKHTSFSLPVHGMMVCPICRHASHKFDVWCSAQSGYIKVHGTTLATVKFSQSALVGCPTLGPSSRIHLWTRWTSSEKWPGMSAVRFWGQGALRLRPGVGVGVGKWASHGTLLLC